MIEFLQALQEYSFIQYAVIACVLASIACGVVGSYVVVKRVSFIAGSIAHCVFAGMGIAYFYNSSPFVGALITAILAAALISVIKLRWKQQQDILISMLWSGGMAIGILFISKTPGYNVDLMSYMFGNILLISQADIYAMLILNVMILIIVFTCYEQFLLTVFDEEFARTRGINVELYYLLLMCLISVTVVLLIKVVGLIMVIALLSLPASIANHHIHSLKPMMLVASLVCLIITLSGLMFAYINDLPAGAMIVLLCCIAFMISLIVTRYRGQA